MATLPSKSKVSELYDLGYDVETLCDNLKNYPEAVNEYFEHDYEGGIYVVTVTRRR